MTCSVLSHLPKAEHGEGSMWDVATQKLHWVDISGFKFHRIHLDTLEHEHLDTETYVGFGVLDSEGRAIVGLKDGIYRMEFGRPGKTLLAQPATHNPENRFNDGKVAPDGTLFAGTMNLHAHGTRAPTGALYSLNGAGWRVIAEDIHISNGLGWSPDAKTMYYTDTLRHEISMFDYDVATGTPSNRRRFVAVPFADGYPDGLCIDADGRVLTALWGGSRINVYTPDGRLDEVIWMDVRHPSSVAFGGADLKTLYITTASVDLTPEEREANPLSGHIFARAMTVGGMASERFAF